MIVKKRITVLILACVCFLSTHAQHSCKDCIYDLYKVLGTCQSKYIDIDNNTYSVKSLYQGKSDSIIFAAITKGHVFSYGNPLDSVVVLDLGDKALYFMVTTEPPRSFRYSDINCAYDSNGRNLLSKEDYMKFPAVINDPDGFTYVRERPSTKSKAKTKIRKNQIFLYTPIWGSGWCRAYSDDGSLFIGYIYRKRILPFDKCLVDIKKKMIIFMFD
nr:SH3 domain-containing protein [uncultured Prevotella sp.]